MLADLQWLTIVFAMVGKFCVSSSNVVMPVFTAELFPTTMRNLGVGSSNVPAGVALMLVPYLWNLVTTLSCWIYIRPHQLDTYAITWINPGIPILSLPIFLLMGILLSILLTRLLSTSFTCSLPETTLAYSPVPTSYLAAPYCLRPPSFTLTSTSSACLSLEAYPMVLHTNDYRCSIALFTNSGPATE